MNTIHILDDLYSMPLAVYVIAIKKKPTGKH